MKGSQSFETVAESIRRMMDRIWWNSLEALAQGEPGLLDGFAAGRLSSRELSEFFEQLEGARLEIGFTRRTGGRARVAGSRSLPVGQTGATAARVYRY